MSLLYFVVHDVIVKKSSRLLSHLLMSFLRPRTTLAQPEPSGALVKIFEVCFCPGKSRKIRSDISPTFP